MSSGSTSMAPMEAAGQGPGPNGENRMTVIDELIKDLGAGQVMVGSDIPARNSADASGLTPTPPQAVVLPRTTKDVSAALRICHSHGQPIVTQGGLTGLAGGAHPKDGEVAISLERMTGIEEVDLGAATLTALAGTPLQVIQKAAEEAGFLCGIDLGARGSCTIGGNIATNAGGNQVLRYGMARRNVLGLEVVLADGTIVRSLNKMLKNNAGYDWTQMFIGSEGTLGVVTRVVLGLHARPEGVQTALCAVKSVEDALVTLRAFEKHFAGGLLVFEGMWQEFMQVATGPIGMPAPFAAEHEILLLVEAAAGEGQDGLDRFENCLAELHEAGFGSGCGDRPIGSGPGAPVGLPRVALRIRPAISKADRVRREHSALAPRRGHDLLPRRYRQPVAGGYPGLFRPHCRQ